MSISPHRRRTTRTAVGALSVAGLIALGAAPAAFADDAAPALVVGDIAPINGVQPGSTFDAPVTVTNNGTGAADKVWVYYSVTHGLGYGDVPSNCATHQVPSYDEMTEKSNVVCEFDQTLEPGTSYAPEKSLAVKALDRALYDDLRIVVSDTAPTPDENATDPVAGTAPAVKLVEKDAEAGSDDAVETKVTSDNTADFQVSGADLKGAVGDTVEMKVKFTNAGPAWVLRHEDEPLFKVLVTPPAGTSVVDAHGYCDDEDKDGTYECGISQRWANEDDGEEYTFKLKIDKKVADAKGSVAMSTEERPFDPDDSNDEAAITLDVTGDGDGGGSDASTGGSGGSGDTGSSSGGSTGGSASSGGSGSSSSGGSTGGSETTGGDLASTGSSATLPIAGAAVVAVGLGTGAVLMVRRRRAQGQA